MKFLVITDLHQKESSIRWINELADDCDVRAILFLGDVTDFGTCEDGRKILSQLKKETYLVPGNCDPCNLSQNNADIVHDVHGKAFEIDGVKFAALGGSNITIFNTLCEFDEDTITKKLEAISSEGMILMTHAPSYEILDKISSGINVGSKAIRRILDKYHPIVALSGHIHEDIGIININKTLCINPGPARDGHAVLLEVNDKTVSARAIGPAD